MPRKPDLQLEARILEAAFRLWSRGGERALTMRAVARAAGTTTPTVYERFRDKAALRELLRSRAQQNVFEALRTAPTLSEICARYLDHVTAHPREYELISENWASRLSNQEPRPSFELLKQKLAKRRGGTPGQHARLALALTALAHGTAMLLLQSGVHERVAAELRHACQEAFDSLIENSAGKSGRRKHH